MKNSVLSCNENSFAYWGPVPPIWPFSLIFELTLVKVPVALEIRPDTTAE